MVSVGSLCFVLVLSGVPVFVVLVFICALPSDSWWFFFRKIFGFKHHLGSITDLPLGETVNDILNAMETFFFPIHT